ncbi:MAG: general secretion pathway protein GspB [Pseudomonadota bacterium]|nr:general secretion pathway protein GspB [Gammaproteobacteria bacterium]MDQ3580816.1 general secretion pathway protein GspB [Pseudomonadota bacterium]
MSFILEALKRVEREREAAGQPRLGAVQRLRTPRRFVWPLVFCIALAVNAGVVWTLWHPAPPTAEGVGPPMALPTPAAVAGHKAGPKTAETGHRTAKPEHQRKSDAVRRRGETAASPPSAPPRPRDEKPRTAAPEPIVAAEPSPSEPAAVRGKLPPADPAPATAVRDILPLWMQMPAEWRAAVPDLSINLMAYSQEPSERLVYIKGQRYTEGERVEGKLTIEEITREGVILSYQGRRCLLPR